MPGEETKPVIDYAAHQHFLNRQRKLAKRYRFNQSWWARTWTKFMVHLEQQSEQNAQQQFQLLDQEFDGNFLDRQKKLAAKYRFARPWWTRPRTKLAVLILTSLVLITLAVQDFPEADMKDVVQSPPSEPGQRQYFHSGGRISGPNLLPAPAVPQSPIVVAPYTAPPPFTPATPYTPPTPDTTPPPTYDPPPTYTPAPTYTPPPTYVAPPPVPPADVVLPDFAPPP